MAKIAGKAWQKKTKKTKCEERLEKIRDSLRLVRKLQKKKNPRRKMRSLRRLGFFGSANAGPRFLSKSKAEQQRRILAFLSNTAVSLRAERKDLSAQKAAKRFESNLLSDEKKARPPAPLPVIWGFEEVYNQLPPPLTDQQKARVANMFQMVREVCTEDEGGEFPLMPEFVFTNDNVLEVLWDFSGEKDGSRQVGNHLQRSRRLLRQRSLVPGGNGLSREQDD